MMTTLLVVLVIAIVVIGIAIATKNSIKTASNQVEEAFSTMDVYLKKRHDLIPNLVNTVKSYAKHETDVLDKIAQANTAAAGASTIGQAIKDEEKLDSATNHLIAIAQAYPDLKANQNYDRLMKQLEQTENDIANARKYYNASVKQFNNKIETFPGSLFAGSETPKPYFQVSSEADRQSVDVTF